MAQLAEKPEEIPVLDIANYVNTIAAELAFVARGNGLLELAEALDRAHELAAREMIRLSGQDQAP